MVSAVIISTTLHAEEILAKTKHKQRVTPVHYYSLKCKASGYSACISNGQQKNDAVVIEWTDIQGPEQLWRIEPVDGPWCQFIVKHSGKAMKQVEGSDNPVRQGIPQPGNHNFHWKFTSDADGYQRIQHRKSKLYLTSKLLNGAHGDGFDLVEKKDSDTQKWQVQLAQVEYVREDLQKMLSLPAAELIGRPHPSSTEDLTSFLHGTTWSIRYGSTSGHEEYRMTFDTEKNTLTLNTGRVSTLHILGPKTIKIWNHDHGIFSSQFSYFSSVDAADKPYFGVLLPMEQIKALDVPEEVTSAE